MSEIVLTVRSGNQTGALHFIKYRAVVELLDAPAMVKIEMVSFQPQDAPSSYVHEAIDSVRRGAQQVLQSVGIGARIELHDFLLHPVDFNARKCELATQEFLGKALADAGWIPKIPISD